MRYNSWGSNKTYGTRYPYRRTRYGHHTYRQIPKSQELKLAQDKLIEQRKKGHYNPIVGGIPMIEDDAIDAPKQNVPGVPGRPVTKPQNRISRETIQATVWNRSFALSSIEEMLRKLTRKT